MSDDSFEFLKKQQERMIEDKRRREIKHHPLVKYVQERGIVSVKKLCKIMDCDTEDITDGL